MILALFLVAAVVLALALVALVWALRGKRIDDHPLCQVCGFDLTGKPEGSTRCSECGADLDKPKSIRFGHRGVRWAWVWGMAPVVALALVVVVGMGTLMVSQADPNRYKPAWWLGYEALSSNLPARQNAIAELQRRIQSGQDLRASLAGRVDEILDLQADPNTTWDPQWGNLVILIYESQNEIDPRWVRFLSQVVQVELDYGTIVEQGATIPVIASFHTRSGSGLTGLRRSLEFHFNAIGIGDLQVETSQQMSFHLGMQGTVTVQLGPVSVPKSATAVELPVTFELEAVVGSETAFTRASGTVPAAFDAIGTRTFKRKGNLRVVPPSDSSTGELREVGTTIDPGICDYLNTNLMLSEKGGSLHFSIRQKPSVLLAYDVFWEANGELLPTGNIFVLDPMRPQIFIVRLAVPAEISAATTPLVLLPSANAARTSIHALPYDRQPIRLTPLGASSSRRDGTVPYRAELYSPTTKPTSPR